MDYEAVTAEQALNRAFWQVKLPSLALLVLPLLGYATLARQGLVPDRGMAGLAVAGPVFAFAFIGGWLAWSLQVPRWRLWAYRRVRDIEHLKDMAVADQILWPEGSFFEKTEIMSRELREELRRLEARSRAWMDAEDEYEGEDENEDDNHGP